MKRFQGRIPLVNTFGKASLHPVDGTPRADDVLANPPVNDSDTALRYSAFLHTGAKL